MQLKDLLAFDGIVIQCHDFPDADTIASGYGVYCYLKANGKNPRLIYSGSKRITKPNLKIMIDSLEIPVEYADKLETPELLISVDCVHGEKNVTFFNAENYAVIDHHLALRNDIPLSEVRPNYGSCSAVVAGMLKKAGYDINNDIRLSTALYYGLYTDTNGFAEIVHPADRDLRDFAAIDSGIINVLMNSNLSLPELKIAGNALNNAENSIDKRYAVVVTESCDPNILGFINDIILQVDSVDVSVVCCPIANGLKLSVRSCTDGVRATEIVDYITEGVGSGGGHIRKAGGFIRAASIPREVYENPEPFLAKKVNDYYDSFDVVHADKYIPDVSGMKLYEKLPDTVGYVRTTDIIASGTPVILRTKEADMNICTGEDVYIMVGKHGSIYPIDKEKFNITYVPEDKPFEVDAEYNPTMITGSVDFFDITPYARCCNTTSHIPIYARELQRTLKLYTQWDSGNYMLGRKGDYFAVRSDDLTDMYIISRGQFEEIYAPVEKDG